MTDIEISSKNQKAHIEDIAEKTGIPKEDLELYGKYKAKVPLKFIDEEKIRKSRLILVTAISPTPAGEGKTTTSIGLTDALNKLGKKTIGVLREPSLGPVFGLKGGATGGGYAQMVPMEDINLHFTGDFSAIEKAHNLLSAIIDNVIYNKNHLVKINPSSVKWKRCIDVNDRSLRNIITGLGAGNGTARETGFDITAASEIMAILCLSRDLQDLKTRLGSIFVGSDYHGKPVFARDLNIQGAMTVLLKNAIQPNLVQTLEKNPVLVHCGPFANIAQGTNSIVATKTGLSLADYVVTEAGFGFDLGGEKFCNIKCGYSSLRPHAIVLVATVRALKYHGGADLKNLTQEDLILLQNGLGNLQKHIENIKLFGITPVVSINKFLSDTEKEINMIADFCNQAGVECAVSEVWEKGGQGGLELAEKVSIATEKAGTFNTLYNWEKSIEEKINILATRLYGAKSVEISKKAKNKIKEIQSLGFDKLPICVAKTQKSLSDKPELLGRPEGFIFNVKDIELNSGAGFIVVMSGDILRMPGLPSSPSAENIDIDDKGEVVGLF